MIQPFGLADDVLRRQHVDDRRAIAGNWVPAPGDAVVGDCGAGLSAGVTPSACT